MTLDEWYGKYRERYDYEEFVGVWYSTLNNDGPEWLADASPEQRSMTVMEWAKLHADDPFWADLIVMRTCMRMGIDE